MSDKLGYVFTKDEAAIVCKVAPRVIAKWVDSTRLKGTRREDNGEIEIQEEDLIRFMHDHGFRFDPLNEFKASRYSPPPVGIEAEPEVLGGPFIGLFWTLMLLLTMGSFIIAGACLVKGDWTGAFFGMCLGLVYLRTIIQST